MVLIYERLAVNLADIIVTNKAVEKTFEINYPALTQYGMSKMADILQTAFSNAREIHLVWTHIY